MNKYLPLLVTLALAGCGGGGGGSSTPATTASTPTAAPTSTASTPASTASTPTSTPTVNRAVGQNGTINGTQLQTNGNPAGGPFPLGAVTASLNTSTAANGGGVNIADGQQTPVPGTLAVTFDNNGNVTGMTYNQNGADHALSGLNGFTNNNPQSVTQITSAMISNATQAAQANPAAVGGVNPQIVTEALTYSNFGVWANQVNNNDPNNGGVLQVGVFASGSPTPASAVPTTGSATYTGDAAGFASIPTPAGDPHTNGTLNMAFNAAAAIGINFGTGAVNSTISNIQAVSMDSIATTATIPNLTGTGNLATGTANYSTSLAGGGMTGNLNGTLYGPTAQETAGTFSATGGGSTIIGAYGAHK
jgi:hypothetical protein